MSAESVRACRKVMRLSKKRRADAKRLKAMGFVTKKPVDEAWAERERKNREAALRLCAKHFRNPEKPAEVQLPTPIVLRYDYWQARSCGWDVLQPQFSRLKDGTACEPGDSFTWQWWDSMHYKQRDWIRRTIKKYFFSKSSDD